MVSMCRPPVEPGSARPAACLDGCSARGRVGGVLRPGRACALRWLRWGGPGAPVGYGWVVRVMLGCSLGGEGHLIPLVQVGRAIERAGHEVLAIVPPAMARSAERTGLCFRVGDEPQRAVIDDVWRRVRGGPPDAVAGLIDRELFADQCTQHMLEVARAVCEAWRPDFVVREPCEYASAIVAHEAAIRQAQVGISPASIEYGVRAMVAPIIERFSPGVAAAIGSAPYLTSFPPSLDHSPWPDTRRFRRPLRPTAGAEEHRPGNGPPLVYVTLGTVLGHLPEALDVYRGALEALGRLPVRVLLAVGRATDPAMLGPAPQNTRVEQWVRQDAVLREAAAVVCHGGSGTTLGALAAGVPLVIYPLFADQPFNGRAVQNAGAGLVVASPQPPAGGLRSFQPADTAALRTSIKDILTDPSYRAAASEIAAEMNAMPTLDKVITQLL